MTEYLGSVAGIVGSTIVLVGIAKRALGNVAWLRAVPTWICAVVVAAGLTVLARFALGVIQGDGWELVLQAVVAAAMASGFRDWWTYAGSKLGDSQAATAAVAQRAGEASQDRQSEPWGLNSIAWIFVSAGLIWAVGCASVDADSARLEAVKPLIAEHVVLYPEQEQTWSDFVRSWERSIDARR
jgi:hypothetical protein